LPFEDANWVKLTFTVITFRDLVFAVVDTWFVTFAVRIGVTTISLDSSVRTAWLACWWFVHAHRWFANTFVLSAWAVWFVFLFDLHFIWCVT
jgi:hypothetical protein